MLLIPLLGKWTRASYIDLTFEQIKRQLGNTLTLPHGEYQKRNNREFYQRRRRRQRERQNSNRFIKQNNKFGRPLRFFVHFFVATAQLRRENGKFHVLWRM